MVIINGLEIRLFNDIKRNVYLVEISPWKMEKRVERPLRYYIHTITVMNRLFASV